MKHRTKLFYKNVDGEDTFLIAEGDSEAQSAENAVKEYQVLREIYGEDKLPISNICLLYTSPSPRDNRVSRMPSSA